MSIRFSVFLVIDLARHDYSDTKFVEYCFSIGIVLGALISHVR